MTHHKSYQNSGRPNVKISLTGLELSVVSRQCMGGGAFGVDPKRVNLTRRPGAFQISRAVEQWRRVAHRSSQRTDPICCTAPCAAVGRPTMTEILGRRVKTRSSAWRPIPTRIFFLDMRSRRLSAGKNQHSSQDMKSNVVYSSQPPLSLETVCLLPLPVPAASHSKWPRSRTEIGSDVRTVMNSYEPRLLPRLQTRPMNRFEYPRSLPPSHPRDSPCELLGWKNRLGLRF